MTQLKPEARPDVAPGLAEAGGPGSGTPRASTIAARTVTLAVAAVLVAAIATASAAGIGPALRWWPPAPLAAVTVVYVAAIGFRLLMICVGSTVVPRLGAVPATRDEEHDARLPAYTVLAPLTGQGAAAAETSRLIADLSALDYPAGRLEVLLLAGEGSELPPGELADRFTVVSVGSQTLAEAQARGLARATGELCVELPARADARQAAAACRGERVQPATRLGGLRPIRVEHAQRECQLAYQVRRGRTGGQLSAAAARSRPVQDGAA